MFDTSPNTIIFICFGLIAATVGFIIYGLIKGFDKVFPEGK
jgi:hypothetical protein